MKANYSAYFAAYSKLMLTKNADPRPATGLARYGYILAFAALVIFFLISFPGNRSEADDGFQYAYAVRSYNWAHLFQPRYLLFLPLSRLIYELTGADPYFLMCVISSLCSAGTLVICYRLLTKVMQLDKMTALWGCAFLLCSYGYWRYSVEAEVYSMSNLLCISVLYMIFRDKNVVLTGMLAGLAVLLYKPNAMPLFFAFPFAYLLRMRRINFFIYPAVGAVVVLAGYFAAYRYAAPEGTFLQFLMDGASRSYGSIFVTAFVVLSNIVSTGFLYGIDAVENFIRHRFPANLIVEEVFAANANGVLNYVALVTLALLGIAVVVLLVMIIRHFSRRQLLRKEHGILLLWIAVYAGVLLYLDPNSPEPWTMLMAPLTLLLTAGFIAPLKGKKWPWVVNGLLFVHNVVGGYGVIASERTDYIAQRSGWLKQHAQKGDLVLSLGSGSMLAYIVYNTPAGICSPEQAFERCMQLAEETIAAGHKVYLTDDMIERDEAVRFRGGEAYYKVADLVERYNKYLVLMNPGDERYGKIYELRYKGKIQ